MPHGTSPPSHSPHGDPLTGLLAIFLGPEKIFRNNIYCRFAGDLYENGAPVALPSQNSGLARILRLQVWLASI